MHREMQFLIQVRIRPKIEPSIIYMDMPTFSANIFLRRCEKPFHFHHIVLLSKFQNFTFVGINFENGQ